MELSTEERESIVLEAMERTLLRIPDVLGNLMINRAFQAKVNREFYSNHKEFFNHKDVVAAVVERIESENPDKSYDKILELAVPEISKQIKLVTSTDVETVRTPNRHLSNLIKSDNGDL